MKLRRGWILLAVVALLVGACSDRGDDDDSVQTDDEEESTETAGGDGFGTLESPCGEGGGTTDTTAAKANQGGGEGETQGITEDSIAVGTVADPGFSGRPGLNQEIFDAGEAFVAWCNDQGGINGRELVLTQYDAAINEYQARLEEACGQEFAIVGDGAVQDNLWATTGAECGLIDIAGFSVTPEKSGVSGEGVWEETRAVQPLPNSADQFQVGAMQLLAEENPGAIDHVGLVYADYGTLITQAAKTEEAYEAIGGTIVSEQTYNILGEANWAPIAQALQNDGVDWLNFVGEGANLAQLQQAMSVLDYEPTVTFEETNLYDQDYLDAAGEAAEGTYIRSVFVPFEEAEDNPATQQYVDLVEAIDGKVALLGAQSMSGWLLFAQSAKECDDAGDLTRTCVLETAGGVTEWDAGGLHAPTDPSTNSVGPCTLVLQVQDGAFVRHAPDEGYLCDEESVLQLEGNYTTSG
jgi:ABC-type branched-subunit amino acid transport system substrate-binding protein